MTNTTKTANETKRKLETTVEVAMEKIIDIDNVSSVYSGKAGKCACGCAGKHTYASKHVKWASKDRGYRVEEEEVNDRSVKLIVNRMNAIIESGDYEYPFREDGFTSLESGDRLYIAYFVTKDK